MTHQSILLCHICSWYILLVSWHIVLFLGTLPCFLAHCPVSSLTVVWPIFSNSVITMVFFAQCRFFLRSMSFLSSPLSLALDFLTRQQYVLFSSSSVVWLKAIPLGDQSHLLSCLFLWVDSFNVSTPILSLMASVISISNIPCCQLSHLNSIKIFVNSSWAYSCPSWHLAFLF